MSQCFKKNRGFSVTELIVSLAIVGIILSTVISNQTLYTDGAALLNLADDLSLTITKAQAYGVAVREFSPGSSDFTASYGVSISIISAGANKVYLFFADRNGNGIYDGLRSCPTGGTNECLERTDISRDNYVDSFCIVQLSGPDTCNTVGRIDITFKRPDVEAKLAFYNTSGVLFVPSNMKGVKIVLKSPRGTTKNLTVYSTGQISVQ